MVTSLIASARDSARLGEVVQSTGKDSFYAGLAQFLAETLECERWLVMRYSRFAAPEFVLNTAMSDDAVRIYLKGLYRLDPLLRLVRSGTREGVFVLSRIRESGGHTAYFDKIFQMSLIYDEAAWLLLVPGGSSIAVCLERSSEKFSDDDIETLTAISPLVQALHRVHLERVLSLSTQNLWYGDGVRSQQKAVLIRDRHGAAVFQNEQWSVLADQVRAIESLALREQADRAASGSQALSAEAILHWEKLDDHFALAPGGQIWVIEPRSPGYIQADFAETLRDFQTRHLLTPREKDIVDLVLQGYPNAEIAKRLGIGIGTVRNHRYRLYFKLDITTERELFFLFIEFLLGRGKGDQDGG
ncbi:MAG: helix-turn-helix transcriptional regulator [Proteobacteria bacterium]|nr:helix-turn-helix transcriptional regulator [Pseudomonadota bacterium]